MWGSTGPVGPGSAVGAGVGFEVGDGAVAVGDGAGSDVGVAVGVDDASGAGVTGAGSAETSTRPQAPGAVGEVACQR